MSAHTAGPWRFAEDEFNNGSNSKSDGVFGSIVSTDDWFVAEVFNDCGDEDGAPIANARLIAAAPELLEAAKHAAMEWRLHGQLTDSCRVLERAIARAEER